MRASRASEDAHAWFWAFAAQGASSATSLLLSLFVGRGLGLAGLGIVFAGFAAYLVLLALHRALVTTPLISSSSTLLPSAREVATRSALTTTLIGTAICACILATTGLVVDGPIGQGLVIFAPWIVPALSQELFRATLIRDGRGRRAAASGAAWLVALALLSPVAFAIDAVWAYAAMWGLASVAAALLAYAATPVGIAGLRQAWRWFCDDAFPFGRWLAVQEGTLLIAFYGLIILLTGILGVSDVGGLRAAESVFAPFSLLAPALVLAGLPALSRARLRSRSVAVRLATTMSLACVLLTLAYAALMLVLGSELLALLYGEAFRPYGDLALPISLWQMIVATGLGFTILLRAEKRGRAILVVSFFFSATTLFASALLASSYGLHGAVWGLAIGAVVGNVLVLYAGVRGAKSATDGRREESSS